VGSTLCCLTLSPPPPHLGVACVPSPHTQLSEGTLSAARSAVKAASALWGSQSLPLLEAEDRLSVACEKGDTADEVLLQLRRAYQVRAHHGLAHEPSLEAHSHGYGHGHEQGGVGCLGGRMRSCCSSGGPTK